MIGYLLCIKYDYRANIRIFIHNQQIYLNLFQAPVKYVAFCRNFLIFVNFIQLLTSDLKKDETGRRGEELALRALEQRGLRLLDRNWRSGHREIDLVMESPDRLHFVEVKTLTPPLQIRPFEKVDPRKQANLAAAARHYVACRKILKEVQFDVVSVVLDGERSQVEYIPEAFYPIVHRF